MPESVSCPKCGGPMNETQPILFPGLLQCEDGDCSESFQMPKCRCKIKDQPVHDGQCPLYEVYSSIPSTPADKDKLQIVDGQPVREGTLE